MKYLWIGLAVVLAASAAFLWWKLSDPVWAGTAGAAAVLALVSAIYPKLLKRKSPEDEKAWRDSIRHGQEWDHRKNKPKEPR